MFAKETDGVARLTASEAQRGYVGQGERYYPSPVNPLAITSARETLSGLSRRAKRRVLAEAAMVNYLAILGENSGATFKDRIAAASGACTVAGLNRERLDVKVTHALGFKGFQGLAESRILDAPAIPALPSVPPSGGPGDGAKSG